MRLSSFARYLPVIVLGSITVGCGGNGETTITTPPNNYLFNPPVVIGGDYGYQFAAYNQNGNLIGSSLGNPQVGAYWQSLTAKPVQLLPLPNSLSQTAATAVSINVNGQIVGYQYSPSNAVIVPLYWSSANAVPVQMKLDSNGGNTECVSINDLGNIVGIDAGGFLNYWSSPTATPTMLSSRIGPNIGGNGSFAGFVKITNGGMIVAQATASGIGLPTGMFVWQTPTSKATNIQISGGITGMNNSGLCVGVDNTDQFGVYWAPPTYNMHYLTLPVNGSGPIKNLGINDSGEIIAGYDSGSSGNAVCFWKSTSSTAVNLNTVTPATPGIKLSLGLFIFNSGTILGIGSKSGQFFTVSPVSPSAADR